MGVKILSLFDGMACGTIAMQLAGVEVESYDAYEIDKYAIKTAQHNSFEDVADHLIAHGVTVQEWISTGERMPTQEDAPTEYVFTAYKNENCYDVNISLWDTVIAYPDLYDYWMPLSLPQPPKGE